MHNVGDHQIRTSDVGVINDVDALKSVPCDNLDAASSWENRVMGGYGRKSSQASKIPNRTPAEDVRNRWKSGKHLRSAGRPARSRECKSLTMKE